MTDLAPDTKPNLAVRDFCTKEGAHELMRRIEQFWDCYAKHDRERIKFSVEAGKPVNDRRNLAVYGVRSNLIRGLPP